ncbi:MAG TPA: NAD(P)H-dependent glycerol-3-phosphate dehydrogenase [Anaerolineaceae bacterium]|nr:NAD(P)H-dependent glycerol-3-phosphate dehydrogenase [Anaerolineaceae bacterium]
MNVGIIGLGNLGAAVGNMIAANGYAVMGWEYNPAVASEINEQHTNSRFLPGISIHPNLRATTDLSTVLLNSQVIFISIPSAFIKSTLQSYQGQLNPQMMIVNLAKGIDRESGLTSFQIISQLFPQNPRVMLSGPSIANEFAHHMPTVVVIAGKQINDLLLVSHLLENDYFRTRFSDDEIGVELGGILKNIYAIGLGLLDGKQITSINFRAVYLTLAMEEITHIGVCMGAKIETFLYLSGIGDLLATSLSQHSHNRRMGELLAQGLTLPQIEKEMGVAPEGFNTLKSMLYLAEKLHVAMPLAKGLWDVIYGKYSAEKFITSFIRDFVE